MGWELTTFEFENNGELARVFRYEARINTTESPDALVLSGDGLLLNGGRIRLNREETVIDELTRHGVNAQQFLHDLQQRIAGHGMAARPSLV